MALDSQEQLGRMAAELARAEERERRKLAADVHDHIIQSLAVSKMKLSELSESAVDEGQAALIGDVVGLIDETIKQTRNLMYDLSPPILYELGPSPALDWLADRTAARYGLAVAYDDRGGQVALDEDCSAFLFRAARELLMNVVKHSSANWAQVSLSADPAEVALCVSDDGKGFDYERLLLEERGGFGLMSIRDRAVRLGGSFSVDSEPGRGTTVTMELPNTGGEGR